MLNKSDTVRGIMLTFLLVIVFINLVVATMAQKGNNRPGNAIPAAVTRGERPPIDLTSVPDSAIETGIIHVKFQGSYGTAFENLVLTSGQNGGVLFGIPAVDRLNSLYKVSSAKKTFAIALRTTQFSQRHHQWGFHLWFTLTVPSGTNIRKMVRDYEALAEVSVAEPVYKIMRTPSSVNTILSVLPAKKSSLNFTPNDSLFGLQWHYQNTGQTGGTPDADIDLPEAWDITKGDTNVIVAVIDEGVEYMHPDLAGNMWNGLGYNFANDTAVIIPGDHGTHVAGTVAANTNNTSGVSGVAGGSGTGNGVRLMSCQVFDPGSPSSSTDPFANAPVWAADHGAAISQNSWWSSTPGYYQQVMLDAIDYFNAHGGGTKLIGGITIFCAGNSSTPGLFYPGCYSGVVGVAATNSKDKKAPYSTYDSWVDLSAPGGDESISLQGGVLSTYTNGTYGYDQGTSMACPHVSGVAALIISMAPGPLTAQDVRDILRYSTDNIDSVNVQYLGKLGSGRLNALKALQLTPAYINPVIPKPVQNLNASAVSSSQINLNWSLNSAADTVVVAYSTTGVFGVPTGNYLPGDAIAGGGTILCKGIMTSFNHTSLTPATKYYYSVWSKNGINYAVVPAKTNATTLCTPGSPPFTEIFNSIFFPVCWSQQNIGTGAVQKWFGSATAIAGGVACEMMSVSQAVNPGTTRLITPAMNTIGFSQLNLMFDHMLDAKAPGATLKVQSSADGVSWSDEAWSAATTATDISATTVNTTIINNLNSTTTYVAFTITGNLGQYDYWYIDNVSVTIPTGNPPIVTTTAVSAIGITGVTSGGNVTLAGTSDVITRGVCWGTALNPNILGNHTIDGAGLGVYTSTITGLLPNTHYHIRAYASNSTGTSYGTDIQFTTLCDVVNVFPFNEGFENGGLLPSCWTQEPLAGSTIVWNFIAGNGGTSPSTAHTGTYNACLKDNNTADTKTRLITPRLNLLSISSPQLQFWHTQAVFITYQDKLSVYYRNSAAGPWTLLTSYTGNIPVWTQETITLPNPTNDYYIAFEGNAKRGNGVCLDDVEITGTLPLNASLQNITISGSHCYNALQTIQVAGDGTTFTVQNFGSVSLIAGQNIIFHPGTLVDSGGYLNGYVTNNGQYCNPLPDEFTSRATLTDEKQNWPENSFLKIYPNPTPGAFNIEISGTDPQENSRVEVFRINGEKVISTSLTGKGRYMLSLSEYPAGLYLVQVLSGTHSVIRKIFKQ